jgi:hypothetical protein
VRLDHLLSKEHVQFSSVYREIQAASQTKANVLRWRSWVEH